MGEFALLAKDYRDGCERLRRLEMLEPKQQQDKEQLRKLKDFLDWAYEVLTRR